MSKPEPIVSGSNRQIQSYIKERFERNEKALALKPSMGLGTSTSKTRITKGLACHTQEGEWEFVTDVPSEIGGSDTGPTPGVLGRAALGSYLAMGYMMWASKLGVPVDNIEIEIEADGDWGGAFGTSDSPAGYSEIRYLVRVESNAPEADIIKALDLGGEHDTYLDNFARAIPCVRSVEIIAPGETTS